MNGLAFDAVAAREEMEDAFGVPRGSMTMDEAALWARGVAGEIEDTIITCASRFTVADAMGEPIRG